MTSANNLTIMNMKLNLKDGGYNIFVCGKYFGTKKLMIMLTGSKDKDCNYKSKLQITQNHDNKNKYNYIDNNDYDHK